MTNKIEFSKLMKMETKDLRKVSKEDLIMSIQSASFYYEHNKEMVKKAEDTLKVQSRSEISAKKTIIGIIGLPDDPDGSLKDYAGDINYNKIDLNELLGRFINYFLTK
jgi:hypothetical protein